MTYIVLQAWDYEPTDKSPKHFSPGEEFVYPGGTFKSAVPIKWLLEQKIVEVKED